MGMDFDVNVKVRTTGAGVEEIDALEKKIKSLKTESIKVKVDVDKSSLSKLNLNTSGLKIKPTVDTSGIKQATKDFQIVKNLATQISQTKIKIAGLDTSKNANEISVLQNQLRKMESDYKVLMKTFGSSFDKSQIGSIESIFGKADDKIAQISAKAKDLSKSMQSAVKPFNQLDATTASNKTLTWLKNNSKAAKDYGFSTDNYQLKVETLALDNGNFILTITRSRVPNISENNVEKKKFKVSRKIPSLTSASIIYKFNSFEDFCDFIEFLSSSELADIDKVSKGSMLYYYNSYYYLIFTNINVKYPYLKSMCSAITEFATYVDYSEALAAKLHESATLIIKDHVIRVSTKYFTSKK